MKTYIEIKTIKEKFEKELLLIDDVIGVGIGKKKSLSDISEIYCIRIYVSGERTRESYRKSLPAKLEDIDVEIVVAGHLNAQNDM
jgi:hypothetical protein